MDKSTSLSDLESLYLQGDRDLHQGRIGTAITTFEQLLEIVEPNNRLHFNIQRGLVKAYQQNQELDKAIAICQMIIASDVAGNALWGQHFLAKLVPDVQIKSDTQPKKNTSETINNNQIKSKTLAQFKQYCQDNLLVQLKTLEQQRKYTLKLIFGSAIIGLILPQCLLWMLTKGFKVNHTFPLYLLLFTILITIWTIFCRGCIHTYKIGFKRQIISSIVDFIGDQKLNYAAHLLLEDKRQTITAFTRSQIFRDELHEPDYLEQEDCVFGKIGNTDIFFAEIFVENRKGGHFDEYGRETYRDKSLLFHGLFFEAQFTKSFVSRTFVMSNDLQSKITPLHNWRGELIKLEDPEFNRMFRVYGDSQIESRYILSTNLMSRLAEFKQKARRKIYLSFIDGFLYLAIPYRHRLFEPKLFTNMMSFTPLKEYFQDLQLMINIVEDLNLNRRIWQ